MDVYQVDQGTALTVDVTILDGDLQPVTSYTGAEALTTEIWPGGTLAVSCVAATTWTTPAAGTVAFTVTAAQSAALAGGRYQARTLLTAPAADPVSVYKCAIDVAESPGTGVAPAAYTSYADLKRHARGWLKDLEAGDDGTGYSFEQGRARSWLEDCAHAHFRVSSMVMVVGGQAFGPRISGARSPWLTEQLAANTLMITDQIVECCAKKALAYVCESALSPDTTDSHAKLAAMFHSQADYLATCITLSLDTDGDGYPEIVIDLSCTSSLFG